ncbi:MULTISPECIES: DMT family transporter [Tenebrionibacter/Tenebrionicola group]|jgi:transporter family-2 protein|uniref:DMT family transporter n=2 Tax=Tenebrionibacter/Tenebrionicola group TaxID=2969848 RepID=A0A8K0V1A8_9ENTR|nr:MULTISPECIES: DMT family transporter [Tenebrionibacter/Tenebrionicola group]MBK4715614.1 DMT family transporter [Tenebrionibacter intestinalis]MBV5094602.1 DMT family transporter [Tenebrionicola larvae]
MRIHSSILLLAVGAGVLLTAMITTNSYLAMWSSPLIASWFAHGSGAVVAWLLLLVNRRPTQAGVRPAFVKKAPLWSYLGGIPGALTVLLAAIAVNSPLALAGSLGLMLTGQILFGLVSDLRGWFGVIKCRFTLLDLFSVALILCGSALLIMYR